MKDFVDDTKNPENVHELMSSMFDASKSPQIEPLSPQKSTGRVKERAYIDGCFDMIHSGHYNAIRQAKALCDTLVVGVNSDEEVIRVKGPTILSTKERSDIIRSCRWVDEVAEGTEYSVSE